MNRDYMSRNHRFTLNVDEDHANWMPDFEGLCQIGEDSRVRGLAFQEEIAPTTGTQHYQGFIRMKKAWKRSAMSSLFKAYLGHSRAAFQKSDFPTEAVAYCTDAKKRLSKEGCWTFGDLEFPQGKRSDLLEIKEKISKVGWKHADLYNAHFASSVRYMNGIEKAAFYLAKAQQVERNVEVCWLWGKAGSGKSRLARAGLTINDYFRLPAPQGGRIWWDGMEGESVLVIEEFNSNTMPIENLLEILDRYPLQLPVKGAFTWANWTKVFITSQFHYSTVYPFASEDQQAALRRRITSETKFDSYTILERDPEDTRFFHLRDTIPVAHTLSHRDNERMEVDPPAPSSPEIRRPSRRARRSSRLSSSSSSDESCLQYTPTQPVHSLRVSPSLVSPCLIADEELSGTETEEVEASQHWYNTGRSRQDWA